MKKKGFTLIELIVTIIILGLITTLVIPMYNNATGKTQKQAYINKVKYIEVAAGNFAYEIKNEIQATNGIVCLSIENLIKQGYLISEEKDKLYLTNPNRIKTNSSDGEIGEYMGGVIELSYVNEDVNVKYTTVSSACATMIEFPEELDDRYIVDLIPPTGTFTINQGLYTKDININLNLSPDDDAYYFCYSDNQNNCTIYYKLSNYNLKNVPYRLPSNHQGVHNIYVSFRDKHGNTMPTPAHGTITYDNVAPTGSISINEGATYSNKQTVSLKLVGTDVTTKIEALCISNTSTCTNWEAISPIKDYSKTMNWDLSTVDGNKTVSVWYRDLAKNVSNRISANIILDTVKPANAKITINDGAQYTTSRDVNLKLSATDATAGLGVMCISLSESCLTWKAYNTESTIKLANVQGLQNVYVIFQDKAGNNSAQVSDTIFLDTVKPTCKISGDSTSWTALDRTITWGCEDAESNCDPANSGGATKYSITTKTAEIAKYTIKDNAGNERTCDKSTVNVYVDKDKPICTNSGDSTSWTAGDRIIKYGCKDDNSNCDPANSGGSKTFNTTTTTSEIGSYTIKDKVGNTQTCEKRTANVYVDKTQPTCSILFTACSSTGTGTCTDADSGVKIGASSSITAAATMSHSCEDNVGNKSSCSITKTYNSCCTGSAATCVGGYNTCSHSSCGTYSCNCKTTYSGTYTTKGCGPGTFPGTYSCTSSVHTDVQIETKHPNCSDWTNSCTSSTTCSKCNNTCQSTSCTWNTCLTTTNTCVAGYN